MVTSIFAADIISGTFPVEELQQISVNSTHKYDIHPFLDDITSLLHTPKSSTVLQVLEAIKYLAELEHNCTYLVTVQAVDDLLQLVEHSQDDKIRSKSVGCIRKLAETSFMATMYILEKGQVVGLISLLKSKNSQIHWHTYVALEQISLDENRSKEFMKDEVFYAFFKLMRSLNNDKKELITKMLMNLTEQEYFCEQIVKANVFSDLVNLLKSCDNPIVKENIIRILFHFAKDENRLELLEQFDFIQPLVPLLSQPKLFSLALPGLIHLPSEAMKIESDWVCGCRNEAISAIGGTFYLVVEWNEIAQMPPDLQCESLETLSKPELWNSLKEALWEFGSQEHHQVQMQIYSNTIALSVGYMTQMTLRSSDKVLSYKVTYKGDYMQQDQLMESWSRIVREQQEIHQQKKLEQKQQQQQQQHLRQKSLSKKSQPSNHGNHGRTLTKRSIYHDRVNTRSTPALFSQFSRSQSTASISSISSSGNVRRSRSNARLLSTTRVATSMAYGSFTPAAETSQGKALRQLGQVARLACETGVEPMAEVFREDRMNAFWKPNDSQEVAILVCRQQLVSAREKLIKGWCVTKLNPQGLEQERVILVTDKRIITAKYLPKKTKIDRKHFKSHDLEEVCVVDVGPLHEPKKNTTRVYSKFSSAIRILYHLKVDEDHPVVELLEKQKQKTGQNNTVSNRLNRDPYELRPTDSNLYPSIFVPCSGIENTDDHLMCLNEVAWAVYAAVCAFRRSRLWPEPFIGQAIDAPKHGLHSKVYNMFS